MTTKTDARERILIVEDDEAFSALLADEVRHAGYAVRAVHAAEEALQDMSTTPSDLVVCDLRLPGMNGVEFLRATRALADPPAFLLITAFGTVPQAVEALKAGADDFLTKPLDLEHLSLRIERTLELRRLRREMQYRGPARGHFHAMIGRSEVMRSLFNQVRQVAATGGHVLIMGPSGTGKELVARAVHEESARAGNQFMAVNCAGIPESLLESEFFGHVAGAFTGATRSRKGLFAEAEGGTLFLDEIAEMPLGLQAKLLRVLQDGRLRAVGSDKEHSVDVRIIAATNRDLEEYVERGLFRADLFYRLETFVLRVPALRERGDDVDLLTGHFVAQFASETGKGPMELSERALELIKRYSFPGNVRELRNAMERAVAFCPDSRIEPEHLPLRMRQGAAQRPTVSERMGLPSELLKGSNGLPTLAEVEESYIRYVLERVGGNKRRAAALLGIARRTLYRRMGATEAPTAR